MNPYLNFERDKLIARWTAVGILIFSVVLIYFEISALKHNIRDLLRNNMTVSMQAITFILILVALVATYVIIKKDSNLKNLNKS